MAQRYGKVKGTKYPIQATVLVPCTRGKSKKISKTACKKRAIIVRDKMTDMFGGYTMVRGQGGFISDSGKRIEEPIIRVTSYAKKKDYKKHKGEFLRFVNKKGRRWGQEQMGVIIENDLIYLKKVKRRK